MESYPASRSASRCNLRILNAFDEHITTSSIRSIISHRKCLLILLLGTMASTTPNPRWVSGKPYGMRTLHVNGLDWTGLREIFPAKNGFADGSAQHGNGHDNDHNELPSLDELPSIDNMTNGNVHDSNHDELASVDRSTFATLQDYPSIQETIDGNGHDEDHDDDDDDDDEYLPTLQEMLTGSRKSVPGPENRIQTRKRNLAADVSSQRSSDISPQKRPCVRPQRPELIDLTSSTESCAICSNVLKHGEESAARAFAFKDCGCVVCGECFLGNLPEQECQVRPITEQFWCPKHDHFELGEQSVCELFEIDCSICLDEVDDKDRIGTPCGHSFCRECWDMYLRSHLPVACPKCREKLPDPTKLVRFQTVQRGAVSELSPADREPRRNPERRRCLVVDRSEHPWYSDWMKRNVESYVVDRL